MSTNKWDTNSKTLDELIDKISKIPWDEIYAKCETYKGGGYSSRFDYILNVRVDKSILDEEYYVSVEWKDFYYAEFDGYKYNKVDEESARLDDFVNDVLYSTNFDRMKPSLNLLKWACNSILTELKNNFTCDDELTKVIRDCNSNKLYYNHYDYRNYVYDKNHKDEVNHIVRHETKYEKEIRLKTEQHREELISSIKNDKQFSNTNDFLNYIKNRYEKVIETYVNGKKYISINNSPWLDIKKFID